jgi:GT2 family glycosyltransferase
MVGEADRLPVYLIHYHAPAWCRSAIESLDRSVPPVNVTVIDNGGLPDLAGVRVLRPGRNLGYAGGANVALDDWLRHTTSKWCVIGSHDLHVEPETLATLVRAMQADPGIGIAGPDLCGTGWNGVHLGGGSYEWVSGTCLTLRRSCVEEVGRFDELLGSYVEDMDYCMRARDHHWDVVIVDDALAHGLGSASRRKWLLIWANHIALDAKRDGRNVAIRSALNRARSGFWYLEQAALGRGGSRADNVRVARDSLLGAALGLAKVWRVVARTATDNRP